MLEEPSAEDLQSVSTLKLLCQMLDRHIILARADLVMASMCAPMYGVVQSMRSLLEQELSDVNNVNFRCDLRDVVSRMVHLCTSLSEVVSPVVCSSSPEGFFPDVVVPCQETTVASATAGESPSLSGNAQSLLLCCWHTMKEVSLLLGILVENFSPVKTMEEVDAALTDDQASTIIIRNFVYFMLICKSVCDDVFRWMP